MAETEKRTPQYLNACADLVDELKRGHVNEFLIGGNGYRPREHLDFDALDKFIAKAQANPQGQS